MIRVRKGSGRGHFDHGWLNTYHTFSFSRYYDPDQMGFRSLRVINEDWVSAGEGFGLHPHEDMEIITYVLEGSIAHKDSLGNGSALVPGELQRMSAGTGIRHSEFNASESEQLHLYQIWLLPEKKGMKPSYEQKAFPEAERTNRLKLVASPKGEEGALTIGQDARLYLATLDPEHELSHPLPPGRHAWLQVLRGRVTMNGLPLEAGDGAALSEESAVAIQSSESEPAEVLLFDLA